MADKKFQTVDPKIIKAVQNAKSPKSKRAPIETYKNRKPKLKKVK